MNIFQQLLKSLYSPSTISTFRYQKIGKTILYVFTLMLIVSIPPSFMLGSGINSFFVKTEFHLTETFPDFEIVNGVLHAENSDPIIINEDEDVIIFDPSGNVTANDISEYESAFAILEREAIFISGGIQESFHYQEFGLNFTKSELVSLVDSVSGILPLLIGLLSVFMYLYLTASKFVGIFALSVLAIILNKKRKTNLSYKQNWTLSAYIVTLPTILFAIFDILYLQIPIAFTIYWGIAFVILFNVFKGIPARSSSMDSN
ncbi:DUF1189 domain-containing protein [Evansella sp. AB-rgal1]|uniref:DUF1189 domain-containing protein n=1 Tax=Evansella sp. AB-rgal1 TaxID=3242696 RepID=UPI00359DD05E